MIKYIPGVSLVEWLFSKSMKSFGKKKMLRLEQKFIELIMDLVFKFCSAGELVHVTCAGLLVNAKACLQLAEHQQFVECEKDSASFREVLPSLRRSMHGSC